MQPPESGRSIGGNLPRPSRDAILGFPDACSLVTPRPPRAASARPDPWRVTDWEGPDLSYIRSFVTARYRTWPLYVPQLELVRCGERWKAALFVRISSAEFPQWSQSVVPRRWDWRWFEPKDHPYVVLRLAVFFEDTYGGPIGLGVLSHLSHTTLDGAQKAHQLRCGTPFDPENPRHREVIEAWVTAPSPVMMFFVDENDRANSYISLAQENGVDALDQLDDARRRLSGIPVDRRSTFAAASAELSLPWIDRW